MLKELPKSVYGAAFERDLKGHRSHDWKPRLSREYWVYFVQGDDGGPIKIGVTCTALPYRLTKLQQGYPFGRLRIVGLMLGTLATEAELHRQFEKDHLRGEWFRASDALVKFVSSLPEPI